MQKDKRVYLDYAAATPLLPAALQAMKPYFEADFANPSANHLVGQKARHAVELARVDIATVIEVRPEYVTFTGGGTEGNNLAILGSIAALEKTGVAYQDMEIVTTRIEHPSITVTLQKLAAMGVKIKHVAVDETGKVNLANFKELLCEKTVLISLAYANSEIGTIQPLHAIKKVIAQAEQEFGSKILLHLDAAQAPLWLSCLFTKVDADLLVLDFAKCNGPKGTGALVRSRRAQLIASTYGGGQEAGLRPGTENVTGIVGGAAAFVAAQQDWQERAQKTAAVRDQGVEILQETVPGLLLNGATRDERLANNINVSIPTLDTEYAAVVLDSKGFAVSTKSACAGAGGGESLVVREITSDPARAKSTLRFSLSPQTTVAELKRLAQALSEQVNLMEGY